MPAVLRTLVQIRGLPAPAYDDEQWDRVRGVALVLVLAAAQLEHVFRDRGMVDFPAVSMAAVRALGTSAAPTDLNLRLDYRLQHILVDEFQDTSSAQLELVRLLTAGWERGDGRSVFCVGDPMQSIYGFRQAEVRAFLELAEEGIGDVRFEALRLRSNFRSAKPLVDWINQCFSAILPGADDRDRGAIAFRPSESAMGPRAGSGSAVTGKGFARRREEADAAFRRTLALAERYLGTNHPTYGSVLNNYAEFLNMNGRKAEAKTLAAQAKDVLRDSARRNGLGMTVDASALRSK
jgi:superfamily I DNA/RNA helicase